jgi:Ca2+-transporting ATPase
LQLLWLNLLTDGLLGLGLGVEKAESSIMQRPPYQPAEGIFARGMGRHIIWLGPFIGLVALGVGYWYWQSGDNHWQTMTFTTLSFLQIGQALGVRSDHDSLFSIGIASNPLLLTMALLSFLLQIAVVYFPPLQFVFGTQALSLADLGISLGLSSLVFLMIESEKYALRRTSTRALKHSENSGFPKDLSWKSVEK